MSAIKLEPIKVVPHFMRQHEWFAHEVINFEAEGLIPSHKAYDMAPITTHAADPY